MDNEWQLWGTFSVKDHVRPGAFVGDVLLYDKLVIPTPPNDDNNDPEWRRWMRNRWRPARQRHLLNLLDSTQIICVPWDEHRRNAYENAFNEELIGEAQQRVHERQRLAEHTHFDTRMVQQVLQGRPNTDETYDSLGYNVTRFVLVDWSNKENDKAIFNAVPKADVTTVPAYGSYRSFRKDYNLKPLEHQTHPQNIQQPSPENNLLGIFGWKFFVPDDTDLSEDELLKRAVDLAMQDSTKEYRLAFHLWRRHILLNALTPEQAAKQMEVAIAQYEAALRRLKMHTRIKWAYAIVEASLDLLNFVIPVAGLLKPFIKVADKVRSDVLDDDVPDRLKHTAMFHDARKRFGWKNSSEDKSKKS